MPVRIHQNAGKIIPISFDNRSADCGIIAGSITHTVANALLAPAGKDLKEVQTGLDNENPHFVGQFSLPDVKIKVAASIEKIKKTDKNVLAMIPPTNETEESEYIIVGGTLRSYRLWGDWFTCKKR